MLIRIIFSVIMLNVVLTAPALWAQTSGSADGESGYDSVKLDAVDELISAGDYKTAREQLSELNREAPSLDGNDLLGKAKLINKFDAVDMRLAYFEKDFERILAKGVEILSDGDEGIEGRELLARYYVLAMNELDRAPEIDGKVLVDLLKPLDAVRKTNAYIVMLGIYMKNRLESLPYLLSNIDLDSADIEVDKVWKILSQETEDVYLASLLDYIRNESLDALFEMRLLELLSENGNNTQEYLENLSAADLTGRIVTIFKDLKEKLGEKLGSGKFKVGVLLPLSYKKFSKFCEDVISGLMLAEGSLKGEMEFIFEDTELKSEVTRQKFMKLVKDDGVRVVIGPLSKKNSEAIRDLSAEFAVPVISLSRSENIGAGSDFMFRLFENKELWVETISDFVLESDNSRRGKNIIVLLQNNSVFRNMANSFSSKISQGRNIEIIDTVVFESEDLDYSQNFKELSAKIYREYVDEDGITKKSRIKKVDYIVVFAGATQSKVLINYIQAHDLEDAAVIWTSLFSEIPQLYNNIENLYYIGPFLRLVNSDYEPIYESYQRQMGYTHDISTQTFYIYYAYKAVELVDRIVKNGAKGRSQIKERLSNRQFVERTLREFVAGNNGEINHRIDIWRMDKNKNLVNNKFYDR